MATKNLVFVYGTLKRGEGNHDLLSRAKHLGSGWIRGARMYDLGAFPAVKLESAIHDKVYGELYQVTDRHLEALDRLEGRPVLYDRTKVQVHLLMKKTKHAWVYVYQKSLDNAFEIPGGKW